MSLINQGFPQPLVAPVALAVAQASARPITGAFGGAPDPYAANGFSPDFVADESLATPYYRVSGADSDYDTVYTSDTGAGGLVTQNDSSGNLVWGPHNVLSDSNDAFPTVDNDLTATEDYETDTFGAATRYTHSGASVGGSSGYTPVSVLPEAQYTLVFWVKDVGGLDNQGFGLYDNSGAGYLPGYGFNTPYPSAVNSSTYTKQEITFTTPAGCTSMRVWLHQFSGETDIDVAIGGVHMYRSDLGGMADVPADQRVDSSLTKFVQTTTTAKYLIRRGHYRYNGTSYVPTLLHEPVGATNLQTYSADIAGQWTDSEVTSTGGASGALGLDATQIIESLNTAPHRTQSPNFSFTSGTQYCAWMIAAPLGTGSKRYLQLLISGNAFSTISTNDMFANFDLDLGTVSLEGADADDSGIIEVADGWYLCYVVATAQNSNSAPTYVSLVDSGTAGRLAPYNGDGSSGLKVLVMQIEEGAVPSSYIPTTGASVTRSADTCKVKAAALPYSSTAISMAVGGRYAVTGGTQDLLCWFQNSNNLLRQVLVPGGDLIHRMETSGVTADSTNSAAVSAEARVSIRAASRYVASTAVQGAINGTAAAADTSGVPAMPALSNDDLFVSVFGTGSLAIDGEVDTLILWSDDIAQAGLESTTS